MSRANRPPMTEADLAAICKRDDDAFDGSFYLISKSTTQAAFADRTALIAEVCRLREWISKREPNCILKEVLP